MSSTFANVFVTAADQAAAQADMGPGYFMAPLSADGAPPATHFWSTGWWLDEELDFICNTAAWGHAVKFGVAQAALDSMKLTPVVEQDKE